MPFKSNLDSTEQLIQNIINRLARKSYSEINVAFIKVILIYVFIVHKIIESIG